MAGEQNKQNDATNAVGTVASVARSAADAIKAVAKAAAGDIAGAIFDVLKNPQLVKAIVMTVVITCFLVSFVFLAVGAIIVEVIQMIMEEWVQNFYDIVTEDAISNGGNKISLFFDAMFGSVESLWVTLCGLFEGDKNHDGNDTAFGQEDYKTTVDSVIDKEAFAGADGALVKRIELIKNRVQERSVQIAATILAYQWDALGLTLALDVCERTNNLFLYNGVSEVTFSYDFKCFDLTDIQCIKIMAAYCTQNECDIQSADIWGIMNYLGWYDFEYSNNAMQDSVSAGTIYDTPLIGRFADEFYGAYSAGTVVGRGETSSIELSAPMIPVWRGSFLPQYLLEEVIQLSKMEAEGLISLPKDLAGFTDWKKCSSKYEYEGGYGLIDYLFTGSAFASFSRTEYTGIDAELDEFLEGCAQAIKDWWNSVCGNDTEQPTYLNVTKNGLNNKCSVTQQIYADGSPSTYMVSMDSTLYYEAPFAMMIAESGTENYTEMNRGLVDFNDPAGRKHFFALNLQPNKEYSIYLRSPDLKGGYTYAWIDSFTTVFDTEEGEIYQAYQIAIHIDISYRARSIDEFAFDIIGLWPGELSEVAASANGTIRAVDHTDNRLLNLEWSDYITDANGNTTKMKFTRKSGNQYEYYLDYIKGISETLGIDTTGVFPPEYNYGDTIVKIASEEFDYYDANRLKSGYRYWDICEAVTGKDYSKESRNGTDWSAVFVMSCAYECGFVGDGNCFSGFGCNASTWPINCTELYNGMKEYSTAKVHTANSYKPSPGDLVFFSATGAGSRLPDQVGIVIGVTSDGKIQTIEGGSHDAVQKCTYSNYRVGAYAYGASGKEMYISAYVKPDYSSHYDIGTQYLNNHPLLGTSKTHATQIAINNQPTTTILVGAGRFRLSQLRDVLDTLEDSYPHLINDYYPTLSNAVDTALLHYEKATLTVSDISTICVKWSAYENSVGENLKDPLVEIAAQKYVGVLSERIKALTSTGGKNTGFDWTKTPVRREILWQIATSTDQSHIARAVLMKFAEGKDNSLSDDELLTILMSPAQETAEDGTVTTLSICYMTKILEDYRTELWPEDHTKLQDGWIACAEKNMNVIRQKYLSGSLS